MSWNIVYRQQDLLTPVGASFRNVVGAMVMSVSLLTEGVAGFHVPPAGIYILTGNADGTVSITPKSVFDMRSPALYSGSVTVVTDTVTPNKNVIPGVGIVMNMVIYEGWISEIGVGCLWDSITAQWIRITSLGLCIPGINGADSVFTVQNDTGSTQSNCLLVVTNGARVVNSSSISRPFYSFRQVGTLNPVAHSDLLGKVVSFQNVYGTADILVDGNPIDIYVPSTDSLIIGGVGLLCDDQTLYRFADGTAYQSCEFILSQDLEDTDTATIFISDGGDLIELWDDTQSDYVAGTTGIYLTGTDCGLGVMLDGDTVDVVLRANPSVTKTIALNQRQFSIRISSVGV